MSTFLEYFPLSDAPHSGYEDKFLRFTVRSCSGSLIEVCGCVWDQQLLVGGAFGHFLLKVSKYAVEAGGHAVVRRLPVHLNGKLHLFTFERALIL